MKNAKKLFLIILFVFGFSLAGGGDVEAVMCNTGLGSVSSDYVHPTVFQMGATWYLISGEAIGELNNGWHWDDVAENWVADAGIVAGLGDIGRFSTPVVFQMGANYYLISGEWLGGLYGYKWNFGTNQWDPDAITTGLSASSHQSIPTVFQMGADHYAIVASHYGAVDGFKWNSGTNKWDPDGNIASGLGGIQQKRLEVFQMGADHYLILGGMCAGLNGYKWNSGINSWEANGGIVNGLTSAGMHIATTAFQKDGEWYLIASNGKSFTAHRWDVPQAKWVTAVCDAKPPAITRLEIRDSDGDTYRGGITTFDTLGNIDIEVDAVDNADLTVGSGVQNITIYWDDGAVNSHTCNFAAGLANATCSRTINLAGEAGKTIKYWATTSDWGGNTVQSPSWGEWCINVNAECNFTNLGNNNTWHVPQHDGRSGAPPFHTFIFPRIPGTRYHITRVESDLRNVWGLSGICGSTWISFKSQVESAAHQDIYYTGIWRPNPPAWRSFGSNCDAWSGDNEKFKILPISLASASGSSSVKGSMRNMFVEGECVVCTANGGACGAPAECCSVHCQNGICCDAGHTCCANDGHCPADSCAGVCELNDNYCDTVTDHYCKNTTTDCPIANTACAGGVCAAANTCDTGHCVAPSHEICDKQCDTLGHCIVLVNCIDHCTDGAPNCGEGLPFDCGGPCPTPCCTCTAWSGWVNISCAGCPAGQILQQRTKTCVPPACDGTPDVQTQCVPAPAEICGNAVDEDCDGVASSCCTWQDDGCGAHSCDPGTQRGEVCVPPGCVDGVGCDPSIPETQCVADPSCCTCPAWPAAWTDAGCGGWTCAGTLMHQTRTRVCVPAGCGTELDNQCVADPFCLTCTPNGCGGGCPAGCSPAQDPDCDATPPDPLKCNDCRCATDGDCQVIPQTCNIDVPPSCCAGCAIADPDCPAPSPDPTFKPMECCRLDKIYDDVACVNGGNPGDPGREIVGPALKVGQNCTVKGESVQINCGTKDWGILCTLGSIYKAGDWLFYLLLAAAVLMASISAYYFLGSAGDPQKTAVSKNMLYWIGGAVALALISKVIPVMIGAVVI